MYKKASQLSESIDFNLGSFRANSYTAIVFNDIAVYDSAVHYNEKALPFAEKIDYKKGIAATYINLGNTYQFFGQYDKVTENYLKGIEIFEANEDSTNVSKSYQNLAALFASIDNRKKEIEYLKQALIANTKSNELQNGYIYGDLGLANLRMNKNIEAFRFFQMADSLSRFVDDNRLDFFVASHFGDYYLFNLKYKNAIPFYEKALQINSNFNDVFYKADVLFKLGEVHSNLNNYKDAKRYLKEALTLSKSGSIIEVEQKIYAELSKINEMKGNYKEAYRFKSLSSKFTDSLKNERYIKQINRLEKQFETKKKDAEINEQKFRLKEQKNELQKKQMQTKYAIGVSGLLLILSIASWLVYKQRQKRKDQELLIVKNEAQINALESLIEGEEKERIRIAKELHDGVNGDLSAIKHKLNTLLKLNNKTIEEAVVMIDKSCDQVRAISHNLVPPALENFDLQTAASDYCTNMNSIHVPTITFNFIGEIVVLPKIVEVNIFRIIQELVTNSIKHAEASEINIQLSCRANALQLATEDDGKGFNVSKVKKGGVGISNIKNRVKFLNGEMDVSSSSKGTSINIFMDTTKFNHD